MIISLCVLGPRLDPPARCHPCDAAQRPLKTRRRNPPISRPCRNNLVRSCLGANSLPCCLADWSRGGESLDCCSAFRPAGAELHFTLQDRRVLHIVASVRTSYAYLQRHDTPPLPSTPENSPRKVQGAVHLVPCLHVTLFPPFPQLHLDSPELWLPEVDIDG